MRDVKQLEHELNQMILNGQALEAFEKYYADDLIMQENNQPPRVGKTANRDFEKQFTQKLKVGEGIAEGTTMGPLSNPRRLAAMQQITEDAVKRGAKVALGGERIGSSGNYFAPTVLTDVPLDAMVFNQEPFGPLAALRGFDTIDEAIVESNRLPFGLASYAYTRSLATAHALSQRLEVGMLWVNQPALAIPEMPFGGVKDSGYGSEGGPEALDAYLVTKSVSILVS